MVLTKQRSQGLGCAKVEKIITSKHSTLRRHMASLHAHRYRKWCEANHFDSMLPEDTKRRREAALDTILQTQQTTLTAHFNLREPDLTPYSDSAFEAAAIAWLIQSNQPIQAFKNPAFKKMIDIASRATRSITLPAPKKTRGRIIHMFKQQMFLLKKRLNVCVPTYQLSSSDLLSRSHY
ncbi:hypothetical protein H4582DRAFT_1826839 [Lactarius indigo]|nr:hypothetical protein H4582DRAFT_1826839 [Lactarius indigo]